MSEISSGSEWDLIIVGGGAAGFFSAIITAEHSSSPMRIAILEKSSQLLQKVKISGGGRCNVTHDCLDPKELAKSYPRGHKSLIGPFHHFGPTETIEWFNNKGVELKVEKDGRMFPTTDSSQTIIDCLTEAAINLGVEIFTKSGVSSVTSESDQFTLNVGEDITVKTKKLLLATGGTRLTAGAKLAEELGHTLHPPVPSLFTFTIDHPLVEDLEGLSVNPSSVRISGTKYENTGPLLITHWGVSGPGILKLSALAARDLAEIELIEIINNCELPVSGKSINKDEFVTCGGVELKEINLKTMESKLIPNLYFSGEIMNIDGVTGGFNFQNAWTSGYLAGINLCS